MLSGKTTELIRQIGHHRTLKAVVIKPKITCSDDEDYQKSGEFFINYYKYLVFCVDNTNNSLKKS